jgi:outer membrane receptor for ferrienterochelin and colicins
MQIYISLSLLTTLIASNVQAQQRDTLKKDSAAKQLKEVVITGTRTLKSLQQVPIPITRITSEEIKKKGLVRLNEVLSEQTGMTILDDPHGQGIQIRALIRLIR